VLIHIHYQIKNSQQCPSAVAFLKFNHWCQDGFDNVSLILLAHIYCSKVQIFGWRYFYWCVYRLLQNSPLNAVFTFTFAVSFYNVSHSLEHYIANVFQKPSPLDVIRVYHCVCQYTIFSNAVSISRHQSPYSASTCTSHPLTEFFNLSILASLMWSLIVSCRSTIASVWHDSALPEILNSSHHCSHVTYSSLLFSCVACSIKSRSMLSLAMTNDAVHLNFLILYHLLDIHVTFVSHYIEYMMSPLKRVMTCRIMSDVREKSYLVMWHIHYLVTSHLYGIDDVTAKHAVTCCDLSRHVLEKSLC